MTTIHKYKLSPFQSLPVQMAAGADIISVGCQGDDIVMWAKVTITDYKENRYIRVIATGEDMHEDMGIEYRFIGTVQMFNGLVFHVFEVMS